MKKHVLDWLKGIAFAAVLFWVIAAVYNVLKWKDTTGDYLSSVEQLYATGENLIDVVFVGSSHCYCGIYPAVLWEEYGISAFDMAVSGQDKDSAYHDLAELFKTQRPSVVFVDLYALLFDEHLVDSNVYRNYLSLRISPNSIALVNKYIAEDEKKDFLFRFPIIHTRYRELKKYDFTPYAPNSFGRGECYEFRTDGAWMNREALGDRTIGELTEKNRSWLEDLILLAEENGAEIEFIVIPFSVSNPEQEILNAAEDFLSAGDHAYTDFNRMLEELGIDLNSDFCDQLHLNVYGAEKLSSYLGKVVAEKYAPADHRGDGRYHQWDDDLRWYRNEKIKQKLKTTEDPYEYAELLGQFSDGVTVISLEGDFLNGPLNYYEILKPLGMDYAEYAAGGKWIYRDGSLQKIMENAEGSKEIYLDLNRYERLRIGYYGEFDPSNILLGQEVFQTGHALIFVTYDTFLEEIVTNLINFQT